MYFFYRNYDKGVIYFVVELYLTFLDLSPLACAINRDIRNTSGRITFVTNIFITCIYKVRQSNFENIKKCILQTQTTLYTECTKNKGVSNKNLADGNFFISQ